MVRLTLRSIAIAIVALTAIPAALSQTVSADTDALTVIQPGNEVETPVGYCTLNFAFRDGSGRTYMGTAGHCVEGTGGRVRTDGVAWGTVALDIDGNVDFALLRVDNDKVGLVRGDVRHWGGPTGVFHHSETGIGEPIVFYGYGMGASTLEQTRGRQGVLVSDSPTGFSADMPAVWGDSGGPIMIKSTGKAMGIVSSFGTVTTDVGPTMPYILNEARARGFDITLVTAAYGGALV